MLNDRLKVGRYNSGGRRCGNLLGRYLDQVQDNAASTRPFSTREQDDRIRFGRPVLFVESWRTLPGRAAAALEAALSSLRKKADAHWSILHQYLEEFIRTHDCGCGGRLAKSKRYFVICLQCGHKHPVPDAQEHWAKGSSLYAMADEESDQKTRDVDDFEDTTDAPTKYSTEVFTADTAAPTYKALIAEEQAALESQFGAQADSLTRQEIRDLGLSPKFSMRIDKLRALRDRDGSSSSQ